MRIFKFGGASIKDADGVKNLVKVLRTVGHDKTLVVISAMGKTTNAIEVVIDNYFNNKKELQSSIQDVKKYHNGILLDLFENENHDGYIHGFTENYIKIKTPYQKDLSNSFHNVELKHLDRDGIYKVKTESTIDS